MTRTVIHGGQVFDSLSGTASIADVAINGNRIVDVGTGLDGDEAIDATGHAVSPGDIDSHVPFLADGDLDPMRSVHTPFSMNFYLAAERMARTLAAGITTVREAGGSDLGVKQAQVSGLAPGPHMQISISILSQTGGHGDSWEPCGAYMPNVIGVEHPGKPHNIVDGPEEMRKKVRQLIRAGADVIKVCTSGGVLSPRDDPRHGHFRDDELDVLVAEATAAGKWVMAHAQATEGIKSAIRAG
ncbi:MAG: amidohydrolase family protein, partial [Ilumatobacteraceae bacterium]